jgi:hypothetical protein
MNGKSVLVVRSGPFVGMRTDQRGIRVDRGRNSGRASTPRHGTCLRDAFKCRRFDGCEGATWSTLRSRRGLTGSDPECLTAVAR